MAEKNHSRTDLCLLALSKKLIAQNGKAAHPSWGGVREDFKVPVGLTKRDTQAFIGADVYAWTLNTRSAVSMACASLPMDSVMSRDLLPSSKGWWWLGAAPGTDEQFALLFADEGTAVYFKMFVCNERRPTPVGMYSWSIGFGETLNEFLGRLREYYLFNLPKPTESLHGGGDAPLLADVIDASIKCIFDDYALFLAGCAWMKQEIVATGDSQIPKPSRSALARKYKTSVDASKIKIVELRRRSVEPWRHDGTETHKEWAWRWVVNGHWRNQPYKDNQRKLIYILPYVKGPDDKPLKAPSTTVFSVSR